MIKGHSCYVVYNLIMNGSQTFVSFNFLLHIM